MVRRFVCLAVVAVFALVALADVVASADQPAATLRIRENVPLTPIVLGPFGPIGGEGLMTVHYSCPSPPPGSSAALFTQIFDRAGAFAENFPFTPVMCDGETHTITTSNFLRCCIEHLMPGKAMAIAHLDFITSGRQVTLVRVVRTVMIRAA